MTTTEKKTCTKKTNSPPLSFSFSIEKEKIFSLSIFSLSLPLSLFLPTPTTKKHSLQNVMVMSLPPPSSATMSIASVRATCPYLPR